MTHKSALSILRPQKVGSHQFDTRVLRLGRRPPVGEGSIGKGVYAEYGNQRDGQNSH